MVDEWKGVLGGMKDVRLYKGKFVNMGYNLLTSDLTYWQGYLELVLTCHWHGFLKLRKCWPLVSGWRYWNFLVGTVWKT